MENNDILSSDLQVDHLAKTYLAETAKWAKFLSILGFILYGILALVGFMVMVAGASFLSTFSDAGVFGAMGAGFIGFFYILLAAIGIVISVAMYRFATRTQFAIAADNSASLTGALSSLRMLFRIMGIIAIIYLAFIAIFLLIGIVGGIASR